MPPQIENGYFLISRLLFESRLWQCNADEIKLAIYLIGTARHDKKPKKFPGFQVNRGELVTSLSQISENCQWYENRKVRSWSRQKVSRVLNSLTEIEFLTLKSDTYGTHICICNYDKYQSADNYKSDAGGTTMEQQRDNYGTSMDTYNNDNNVKNVNNVNNDIPTDTPISKLTIEAIDFISSEHGNLAPKKTDSLIKNSIDAIDKLIRIDGFTIDYVKEVLTFGMNDDFWKKNVLSLASLRKKGKNDLTKFQNLANSYKNGNSQGKPVDHNRAVIENEIKKRMERNARA